MFDDTMVTAEKIDDVLDDTLWARNVMLSELSGVSKKKSSSSSQVIGVQESSAVRKVPFRIFNMLTYTAYNPESTINFLKDEYPQRSQKAGLFNLTSKDIWDKKAESLYNNWGNPHTVVPRKPMKKVAETLKYIHQANFEDATRYYVQPHARILRVNYNKFNILCDPVVPGGPVYYRTINAPVRLIADDDATGNAMNW